MKFTRNTTMPGVIKVYYKKILTTQKKISTTLILAEI